jgi:hypothetical protein
LYSTGPEVSLNELFFAFSTLCFHPFSNCVAINSGLSNGEESTPRPASFGDNMKAKLASLYAVLAASLLLLLTACTENKPAEQAKSPGVEEAVSTAVDAYIYGYPLVTMDMTRRQVTNVAAPDATHAPMGQLVRFRTYPPADMHTVTAPNADTLYTTAFVDVSKEPWIFSIPDMGDRYYLMPMLDGWTDVFQVPGKRTTGDKAQKYAITGPGWSGTLPAGVTEYKSPTGLVWILGRIAPALLPTTLRYTLCRTNSRSFH